MAVAAALQAGRRWCRYTRSIVLNEQRNLFDGRPRPGRAARLDCELPPGPEPATGRTGREEHRPPGATARRR